MSNVTVGMVVGYHAETETVYGATVDELVNSLRIIRQYQPNAAVLAFGPVNPSGLGIIPQPLDEFPETL